MDEPEGSGCCDSVLKKNILYLILSRGFPRMLHRPPKKGGEGLCRSTWCSVWSCTRSSLPAQGRAVVDVAKLCTELPRLPSACFACRLVVTMVSAPMKPKMGQRQR